MKETSLSMICYCVVTHVFFANAVAQTMISGAGDTFVDVVAVANVTAQQG